MKRSFALLAAAFAVSFLAVGWTYWPVPYAQVSLPDTLLGVPLLVVVLAAAIAVVARAGSLPTIAIVGAATPLAVLARVVHDTHIDPTSHNLWPFEVVLAGLLGVAVALAGVGFGWLVVKAVPALARR